MSTKTILVLVFQGDREPSRERILGLIGEEDVGQEILTFNVTEKTWRKTFHQNVLSYNLMVVTARAPQAAQKRAHYIIRN